VKSQVSAWPTITVGELLNLRYGKALPAAQRDPAGRYPVVGSAGRMSGTHAPLVAAPAVIVGRKGSAGAVRLELHGCWPIDTTYYAEIPDSCDPRFLRWQLHALELGRFDSSTTTPSLRRGDLESQTVVLPPRGEQRRIVALLEDHLSRLDAAQESVTASIRRSSVMMTASLAEVVAAGTAGSTVSTVGAEAERVEYGSSARCHAPPNDGDVPVLRMGNLKDGRIDSRDLKFLPKDHPEFPKLLLAPGDLLFNRTNSAELVGKSAVFDSATVTSFASYLIRVRFRATVDPRWASIVINSPQGRAYIASVATQQVGQANVNGTKLKAFPLPIPSPTRQRELVATHERTFDDVGRLHRVAEDSLRRSAALRRSLLAAAFSGQLTAEMATA
jgi:type I restriction enzyme S subunit